MCTAKYALHPGWITSKTDKQRHYIDARRLAELYRVPFGECIVWTDKMERGTPWERYIHLFPSYQGNYKVPERRLLIR